jgi:hypothetical protein
MSVWLSIGGGICVAASAVGLVLSWMVWRKKGATRGIRAVAWSLLPLAAYLTGAVRLLGTLVSAIVRFSGSFVFSPKSWAGVIVVGVAAVLFLASGGLPLLNWRKARERRKLAATAGKRDDPGQGGTAPQAITKANRRAPVPGGSDDDDLGDVQEILRRRGIK